MGKARAGRIEPLDVVVSDHALVRWLERAHGIDMEFFRRKLAGEVGHAAQAGASGLVLNGLRFALDGGRVITVTPVKDQRPRYRCGER
jgi:hypothetical protein